MSCRYGTYDHQVTHKYYCEITGDTCKFGLPSEKRCKTEIEDEKEEKRG